MSFPATEAEADDYLTNEKTGTSAWFASGLNTAPYLTEAFNLLRLDPDYSIPSSPDSDQLEKLTNANIELAFNILVNPGSRKRADMIAQGVKSFKIENWSESYDLSAKGGRDIEGFSKYPSIVADLMREFLAIPRLQTTIKRAQENII